ncbi:MAG: hypothetical protein JW908_10820 [Anaerolineales bacterium]|nr:hypothetical protein [Anaerolineales bacterium]
MDQSEETLKPDVQEEIPDTPPVAATEQAFERESRVGCFLKAATRWLFGLLIVFGLGALTVIFLLYTPTRETLENTQANLDAANQKITDLENQVQTLSALEPKNAALQKEVDAGNLHIKILTALADVNNARVALAEGDPAAAQSALANTTAALKQVATLAGSSQSEAVNFIQDRLDLVLGEIETDTATAQSDLVVMATKLLELEKALFGQ